MCNPKDLFYLLLPAAAAHEHTEIQFVELCLVTFYSFFWLTGPHFDPRNSLSIDIWFYFLNAKEIRQRHKLYKYFWWKQVMAALSVAFHFLPRDCFYFFFAKININRSLKLQLKNWSQGRCPSTLRDTLLSQCPKTPRPSHPGVDKTFIFIPFGPGRPAVSGLGWAEAAADSCLMDFQVISGILL